MSTLQKFLRLANYYGNFISNMHVLRTPPNKLLKKDSKWNWSNECQCAFEEIKISKSDLRLTHYNLKKDIVASDESNLGLRAIILHKESNGQANAIVHASRTLLSAEKGYSQIEKEALGIIFAVKMFYRFSHGRRFTLSTDHQPLFLHILQNDFRDREQTIQLNYNFKIELLLSKRLGHADSLSRLIPKLYEPLEETVITTLRLEIEIKSMLCNTIEKLPMTIE